MAKTTAKAAAEWLRQTADMLLAKSAAYGNSLDRPVGIFHRGDRRVGIAARIDDKLSRIAAGNHADTEDSVQDLVGYIALWVASGEMGPS